MLNTKLAKPNETIEEHTQNLLNELKRLINFYSLDTELIKNIEKACKYHDYGKVNDKFQERVSSNKKIKFDKNKEVAHNVLSLCFIKKEDFESKEDFYRVCYAVLNHHHHTDNFKEINEKSDLIEEFSEKFESNKIKKMLVKRLSEYKTDINAQLIKGFLHKCDYSASGGYDIEYPNNFLLNGLEKLEYNWKPLQEYAKKNTDENIILVANTGMGKTEAGLLWIGDNKGFFILPLRTALNAMYNRIKNNVVVDNVDERLALLHSDTLYVYLNESAVEDDKVLEYYSRGKNLSMPLTVSTLDQLFDFVYKYKGFELKLATFSYSKFVLDEIQAYSADLVAYIVSGLEMISKVGGKFAIITATLPPFIQSLLEENIGKIKRENFVSGEKDRHHIKVIETTLISEDIDKFYEEKQGKILVVCNTINKAQNIYKELDNKGYNLNLLHSKYIKKDRSEKENKILEFGKTEHVDNGIWISTSLVEASLDIDFDYLFTELNDLNGLFQRLGRVNRKGEKIGMLQDPNAFVYTEINGNLFINGERGFIDRDIYDLSKTALLDFGCGILGEEQKAKMVEENFTLENLKTSKFVDRYRLVKKYIDSLYVGEKDIEEVKKYFRNIISYKVIPKPLYDSNKHKEKILELEKSLKEKYKYNSSLSKEENNKLRNNFIIKSQKLKNELEQYTVSVGIYDLNKTGISIDTAYENIPVINCEYDENIGFIRKKIEKSKEKFDAFF